MYHIYVATQTDEVAHRSHKDAALAEAERLRKEKHVGVRVETDAGHVIYSSGARLQTPRWSRVETHVPPLAEGVTIPAGYDVAYSRIRTHLLVLRRVGVHGDYLVMDSMTGETRKARNTKETAAIMHQIRAEREEHVAA